MAEDTTATENKILKHKRHLNILFVIGLGLVELVIVGLMIFTILEGTSEDGEMEVFDMIAINLVLLWAGVFIAYLGWAMYFYNINLGLTNEDWDRIKKQKQAMLDAVDGDVNKLTGMALEEYKKLGSDSNPYQNETFGLPPGTVRGAIAISLLFGALALVLFSMGLDDKVEQSQVVQDYFVFFKDAFLMMIAFYFGNSSLKYLRSGQNGQNNQQQTTNGGGDQQQQQQQQQQTQQSQQSQQQQGQEQEQQQQQEEQQQEQSQQGQESQGTE